MKRISTCTKGMVLACAALAFAFAGCTSSDGPATGGIDAELTLSGQNVTTAAISEHFSDLTVTIECDGDDPLTGGPWASEQFTVNVATTGDDAPSKPLIGIFKKEGLPPGECTITIFGSSDENDPNPGSITCGGQGTVEIEVLPNGQNKFIEILVSCITAARYGGVGVDGLFNRCMEYQQIIVSPLDQATTEPVDVDIWCFDPDGDDGLASIFFVTAASLDANPGNPMAWDSCTGDPVDITDPTNNSQPYTYFCQTQDPPIDAMAPHVDQQVLCNAQETCTVVVTVSDDVFASGNTDPFGCNGVDPFLTTDPLNPVHDWNAYAEIDVECLGDAVCGDAVIEGAEECDVTDVNLNGPLWDGAAWCGTDCKFYDPCAPANQDSDPANCPAETEPICAPRTCVGDTNTQAVSCTNVAVSDGPPATSCGASSTCQGGVCDLTPVCTPLAQNDPLCDNGDSCTLNDCDANGQCLLTPLPEGAPCDMISATEATGLCQTGSNGRLCRVGDCTGTPDVTEAPGPFTGADWWSIAVANPPFEDVVLGCACGQDAACFLNCVLTEMANQGNPISSECAQCYTTGPVACTQIQGAACLAACAALPQATVPTSSLVPCPALALNESCSAIAGSFLDETCNLDPSQGPFPGTQVCSVAQGASDDCRGCLYASPVACTPEIGYCAGLPGTVQEGPFGDSPKVQQCNLFDFDFNPATDYSCCPLDGVTGRWTTPANCTP